MEKTNKKRGKMDMKTLVEAEVRRKKMGGHKQWERNE